MLRGRLLAATSGEEEEEERKGRGEKRRKREKKKKRSFPATDITINILVNFHHGVVSWKQPGDNLCIFWIIVRPGRLRFTHLASPSPLLSTAGPYLYPRDAEIPSSSVARSVVCDREGNSWGPECRGNDPHSQFRALHQTERERERGSASRT